LAPISKPLLWTAAVSLAAVVAGCGGIPRVDARLATLAQQHDPSISPAALESARALYITRCSSCHSLNQPGDYPPDEWATWMRKMTPKAKLTPNESQDILTYLLAARLVTP
jgi:mono/diheme cytochrome c family protein